MKNNEKKRKALFWPKKAKNGQKTQKKSRKANLGKNGENQRFVSISADF